MTSKRPFRRPRRAHGLTAAVLASGLVACDIPTDLPILEQRWILPLETVMLEQSELLPSAVSIDGSVYDVAVDPFTASESLGGLCPACVALDGLTAPVPPFTGSFATTEALPTDLLSVDVESGSVTLSIDNGLSFDPIAGGGSVTVTVSGAGGGPTLATLLLESPADALPPGTVTTRVLPIGSGVVDGALESTFEVVSPGTQVATIGADDEIRVDVVTTSLRVNSATVDVDGLSASLTEQELELNDVDADIADGVQDGTIQLDITNPFQISFTGAIEIGGISKNVAVPPDPTSTVLLQFTGQELRSILTSTGATLSGTGTIAGGPATLTPLTELNIDPTIDVILEIGR